MTQRIEGTVAFRGRWLSVAGAILIASGAGLPLAVIALRTFYAGPQQNNSDNGDIRPSMVEFEVGGKALLFAENHIEANHFRRAMLAGEDDSAGGRELCEGTSHSGLVGAVTAGNCSVVQIAQYANMLTSLENAHRRLNPPLTLCYRIVSSSVTFVQVIDVHGCTGYRLPYPNERESIKKMGNDLSSKNAKDKDRLHIFGTAEFIAIDDQNGNGKEAHLVPEPSAQNTQSAIRLVRANP